MSYAAVEPFTIKKGNTARPALSGVCADGRSEVTSTAAGYSVTIAEGTVLSVSNLITLSAPAPGTTGPTVVYDGQRMTLNVEVTSK